METTGLQQTPVVSDVTREYVGVITSIRGLTVEVQIVKERPDAKELLMVDGEPDIFLEVNFFRG